MKARVLWGLLIGVAAAAQAQEAPLAVSLGVKAWNTQWSTFSYANNGTVLTQVVARDKLVLIPTLSARYGDFTGSLSAYPSTDHRFLDGGGNDRQELDLNVGYLVVPGLAVTLGYKHVEQRGEYIYKPAGPVIGISATAPLGGALAVYGALGLGWLKTSGSSDPRIVQFEADYRLSELGVAYNLAGSGLPRAWTFTAGYRTQVLSSKEALGAQDGRDLTQGLTLGLIVTF